MSPGDRKESKVILSLPMIKVSKNSDGNCWNCGKGVIFAPVGSAPVIDCINELERFFEPLGGKAGTRNLKRFSFYSMANILALPVDKGEILLNRRKGLYRFATRYEPKQRHTVNSIRLQNGQVNQSPLGGRGLICFSDLLPPFLILLQLGYV